MEQSLIYIVFAMMAYCMVSARIGAMGITMPMVFLALGVGVGFTEDALTIESVTTFHHLAEVTLGLVLFADATTLRRDAVVRISSRATRMLLLGLPLAIVFGFVLNLLLLPDWPIWEMLLLAALLAPTDAALGQSIQGDERIPKLFRNTLNAESGLNDGLALPFVIFFASIAVSHADTQAGTADLIALVARQILLGGLVGLLGGVLIGKFRNFASARGLMEPSLEQVATLFLVWLIYLGAEHVHGNSFVAVFVAGVAFGNTSKGEVSQTRHFLEGDGQFLAMLSFFFIGALFLPMALEHMTLTVLLLVGLSLLVVRPLAIWISLLGTDTSPNERLFYGWFGPRGLATALFAVFVVMDFDGVERTKGILVVAMTAVLISAFVHGLTAKNAPGIFKLNKEG